MSNPNELPPISSNSAQGSDVQPAATAGMPAAPVVPDAGAVDFQEAAAHTPNRGKSRSALREMLPSMSWKLGLGLFLTFGIILFAIIAPRFAGSPTSMDGDQFMPPGSTYEYLGKSTKYLLGTTKLGEDVFAQMAHGTGASLIVGLVAGGIAVVLSLFFGIVAGYLGGWTDEVLSLVTNIMLVIPGLPLVIVIASYLDNRSMWVIAVILGITSWAGSAIVLRSQAKSLRNRDYVAASRVAGESTPRIILVEILPNLLPLLAAQFLFAVVLAILAEAGLSYLGLGTATGSPTLGVMLQQAQANQAFQNGAWWWFVPPGLVIALFGCGLSLINFSIDEIINPKLRANPAAMKNLRKARKELARKEREERRGTSSQQEVVAAQEAEV